MRPSEAQALGSTLSNLLSQKPKDARYARLQTDEVPPAHGASVQISGRRGPSCCKRCAAFLVVCLLLSALTGSVLYAIGSNTYRVQVQITAGNVITYEFDHKVTINASRVTTRRMSGLVTFWAVNKTERDSWLHMGFSPSPTESSVKPLYLFALKVKTKDEYGDKSTDENYELFSDGKVDGDLAYHIHCLLRQLLPVVKMKLYKVFLSRLRTSYDQVIKVHSPFFPGQTELHQSVSSTHQHVTISNRASSHNFLGFSNGKRAASQAQVAWDFHFNERTVLSKETGMAVDGGLNLTARVPLGEGDRRVSDSGVAHLVVKFDSAVKLRQHDGREVKQGSGFRNAHWASVPFPKPFGSPQVTYFRPQKNQSTAVQELLDNSARLITEGPRRFGNLPAMLSLRYTDEDEEDSEDGDSDGSDFDDGRVEWQTVPPPPPPVPDFGFEDRRKRSLRHRKTHPAVKVRNSRRRKTEISKSDLRTVWDELSASTLPSYPKRSMGVVRTSLFGMPVLGRVEYQVKEMEGDDDDDEDVDDDGDEDYDDQEEDSQWSALVSFYLELGPYRLTAFEGVHTLKNITSEVLRGSGRRIARRDWIEAVGDLVVCAPFLYIRAVCVELRLVLSLGASYAATKFSLNYPVELSLRVEHTAVVSSAMSAHVSSWFHKGGIYSAGGLLQAKLPLLLTFREDARPEWCAKSNIETRLIRLSDVPFAEWNCSVPCKGKFAKAEHSFEELSIRSPLWQNWHFLDSCEDDV